MAIKRCTESFTIWRDGAPVAFVAGQLVDDKHPILKSHGHLFSDPETAARPALAPTLKPVEQATADPGEQRALTPPAPAQQEDGGKPFDPGEHKAPEVLAYLKDANEEERARVLAAEADGQKRKGILGDAAKE
ncbi:hypothetical protein QBA54_31985 [Streptomyces sp. B21-108]|uniref:hypothetical protein n=1 Tax=Streptomyces sp. B21-108 TaxID=3039419 RepID=UPI002FF04C4D